MSFFARYNGTRDAGLIKLETLTWILIYGGLLAGLVGGWMMRTAAGGLGLLVAGAVAVLVGIVLVLVRARMDEGGKR